MLINKVIIYGEFWDSFIYSNNLILFNRNHSVYSYKWDQIINSKILEANNRLAYKCAFLNSEYLYGFNEKDLFSDKDIKELIRSKFQRINQNVVFELHDLAQFKHFSKPIILSQLPTDIGIYKNVLYYCNSDGIFSRNLRKNDKNLISSREVKYWDCAAQCLKIGNGGRIALSASSEGLFEMEINDYSNLHTEFQKVDNSIFQITKKHSSYCDWSFSSLLNGSYCSESNLYGFKHVKKAEIYNSYKEIELEFQGEFSEISMFDNIESDSIIFSGNEKIYRINNKKIDVLNFTQKDLQSNNNPFKQIGSKQSVFEENIVCASVVEFGIVVETQNNLYVIISNGEMEKINPNEKDYIINWRVFPRSKCYVNQLHIIYKNRIEIVSINDDYFVDQKDKIFGQEFRD